jgi:hypothetical protein
MHSHIYDIYAFAGTHFETGGIQILDIVITMAGHTEHVKGMHEREANIQVAAAMEHWHASPPLVPSPLFCLLHPTTHRGTLSSRICRSLATSSCQTDRQIFALCALHAPLFPVHSCQSRSMCCELSQAEDEELAAQNSQVGIDIQDRRSTTRQADWPPPKVHNSESTDGKNKKRPYGQYIETISRSIRNRNKKMWL